MIKRAIFFLFLWLILTMVLACSPKTYVIVFDSSRGTAIDDMIVVRGEVVAMPIPSRTGYTFVGWFDNYNLTGTPVTHTNPKAKDNEILFASWVINQYTITFDTQGGSDIEPITQNYNSDVTAPTPPEKEGHVFVAWYSDAELTEAYTFSSMPAQHVTLYAKWDIE